MSQLEIFFLSVTGSIKDKGVRVSFLQSKLKSSLFKGIDITCTLKLIPKLRLENF